MNLNIIKTKDIGMIADFVASAINRELGYGKQVLWFVSGGSSIPVEVEISRKIESFLPGQLVVTLTDERYGLIDHENSNWHKLKQLGFRVEGAKLVPFLVGQNISTTTLETRLKLQEELNNARFKIGVFGIGIDGHTAGILPRSEAVTSNELVCTYDTPLHDRITITPKTIAMLDEAIVYAMSEMKWPEIEKLNENLSIEEQPAQSLKKVPLLTIFTSN